MLLGNFLIDNNSCGLFPNTPMTGVSEESTKIKTNSKECCYLYFSNSVSNRQMFEQQIKQKFETYKSKWKEETFLSSSISDIVNNESYQSIIALGFIVVPFIINDLKENDEHWFYALEKITEQNPIKKEHRGIIKLMKNDWIEWAKENDQFYEGITPIFSK
jgi:hypothetical protein